MKNGTKIAIAAGTALVAGAAMAVGIMAATDSGSSTPTTVTPAVAQFVVRDATNTGPTGTLAARAGNFNITVAGTVLENVDITGDIGITASNVTIRNCRIHGAVRIGRIYNGGGQVAVSGTTIQNCEFVGKGDDFGINDVAGTNSIISQNNLHGYENCITIWTGTGDQLLSNYCHDESSSSSAPHFDGLEIYGIAGGITIDGNHVTQTNPNGATAPLNLTPTGSFKGSVQITNNLLQSANCAYVILADDSQGSTPIIANIVGNHLIRSGSSCSYFQLRKTKSGSTYTGYSNVDGQTGAAIPDLSPPPVTTTTAPQGSTTTVTVAPSTTAAPPTTSPATTTLPTLPPTTVAPTTTPTTPTTVAPTTTPPTTEPSFPITGRCYPARKPPVCILD